MPRENLPHIQFYPGDWRTDVAVQSLSYHNRGVWFEILMLMHCSEDRGRLVSNGKPVTIAGVARLLGLSERDAENAVQILVDSGVASRDENGVLFNRRMVKEEERRRIWAANGEKGGRPCKTQLKPKAKPKPNPITDIDNDNGIRKRLGKIFGRREATAWSEKELKAMSKTEITEEDLVLVERYYAERIPKDRDFRRRDLLTLLNNYPGEVDRARARPKPKPTRTPVTRKPQSEPDEKPITQAELERQLSQWRANGRPLGGFPAQA